MHSPRQESQCKLDREKPEDGEEDGTEDEGPANDEQTSRELVGKPQALVSYLQRRSQSRFQLDIWT